MTSLSFVWEITLHQVMCLLCPYRLWVRQPWTRRLGNQLVPKSDSIDKSYNTLQASPSARCIVCIPPYAASRSWVLLYLYHINHFNTKFRASVCVCMYVNTYAVILLQRHCDFMLVHIRWHTPGSTGWGKQRFYVLRLATCSLTLLPLAHSGEWEHLWPLLPHWRSAQHYRHLTRCPVQSSDGRLERYSVCLPFFLSLPFFPAYIFLFQPSQVFFLLLPGYEPSTMLCMPMKITTEKDKGAKSVGVVAVCDKKKNQTYADVALPHSHPPLFLVPPPLPHLCNSLSTPLSSPLPYLGFVLLPMLYTYRFTPRDISNLGFVIHFSASVVANTLAYQRECILKKQNEALLQVARTLFTSLG